MVHKTVLPPCEKSPEFTVAPNTKESDDFESAKKYLANYRMQCIITCGWYQTGNTIQLSVAGQPIKYQGNNLLEE
jgi:hypothetical protein